MSELPPLAARCGADAIENLVEEMLKIRIWVD
jgi:hypothetical protein